MVKNKIRVAIGEEKQELIEASDEMMLFFIKYQELALNAALHMVIRKYISIGRTHKNFCEDTKVLYKHFESEYAKFKVIIKDES